MAKSSFASVSYVPAAISFFIRATRCQRIDFATDWPCFFSWLFKVLLVNRNGGTSGVANAATGRRIPGIEDDMCIFIGIIPHARHRVDVMDPILKFTPEIRT